MRKKIRPVWLWLLFLTLFLGLIFQSFPVKAQEQEELRLYSQSVVLMDGLSGRILYGKNAEQKKRDGSPSHGQHHEDHDLYPCP